MKKNLIITILTLFIFSCENTPTVIGTTLGPEGKSSDIIAGNTDHVQIWVNYIDAHNERNLDKIAEINSEDWVGYAPDGNVIKGNEVVENHIHDVMFNDGKIKTIYVYSKPAPSSVE